MTIKDKFLLTEKNFYLILNALDEGIHIVDQNGKTIVYNDKAARIEGLLPEEVLGKNLFEVYPSLTIETSTLMKTIKTGKAIKNKQQSLINSRGKKITTINSTVPIEFENGEIGAMEISRDITQMEELVNYISNLRSDLVKNKKEKRHKQVVKQNNNTTYTFKDIIGKSDIFKTCLQDAMRAAGSDSSVLLYGETGTGKELFAQSIHRASTRGNKPFIAQNCAALPKDLLEGLLFGTQKGGFTGARSRPGLFEQADGGTILLDEINSMDPALQAKLLRVLQENKVRRVGGQNEINIDVRIIATMNMHPDKAFENNRLREDLYYRLNVVYIEIPPLRKRKEDIQPLIEHFTGVYNEKFTKEIKGITPELKNIMYRYNWPGNVRELQHVIESAFNMLRNNQYIDIGDLPGYIKDRLYKIENKVIDFNYNFIRKDLPPLQEVMNKIEVDLLTKAMNKTGGNISAAARELNISRQSLQYKLKKYDIR